MISLPQSSTSWQLHVCHLQLGRICLYMQVQQHLPVLYSDALYSTTGTVGDIQYSGKYWRSEKQRQIYTRQIFAIRISSTYSSSIVCRCHCFVTLKRIVAFPLYTPMHVCGSTLFTYCSFPDRLVRMIFPYHVFENKLRHIHFPFHVSSLNEWVWLMYNRKSAKFKPANMPNFAFPPTFLPPTFPAIRYSFLQLHL